MQRAYSAIEIKAISDNSGGRRLFEGVASTPSTDLAGDIVEPSGAKFKLPIPLLWQHDAKQPIGWVTAASVTSKGIEITGEVADSPEPGTLKDRLLEAWQSMKTKLVRGLSIGFEPLAQVPINGTGGMRFTSWNWLELSAVTIPCNYEATIQVIKAFDSDRVSAERMATIKAHPKGVDFVRLSPRFRP